METIHGSVIHYTKQSSHIFRSIKPTVSIKLTGLDPELEGPLTCRMINPLPDDKILDWSKMKQIAGNILKCI